MSNNRRTVTSGGVTTQYILDGQNVAQEMSPSGVVSYLWGPRGPEARIAPDESVLWYLYDKHGNVLGEVDANGVTNPDSQGLPTPLRKYDVWGGVRNALDVADNGNALQYCGALGHPSEDTGLVYMRARYYDPALGRFISEDPAKDGLNWYSYGGGDPISQCDRTGTSTLADIGMGMGISAGMSMGTQSMFYGSINWNSVLYEAVLGGATGGFAGAFIRPATGTKGLMPAALDYIAGRSSTAFGKELLTQLYIGRLKSATRSVTTAEHERALNGPLGKVFSAVYGRQGIVDAIMDYGQALFQ